MFIPSEGCVFSDVDYSQLELCTLAQSCIARFGKSKMADVINEGKDLHRFLASHVYSVPEDAVTDEQRSFSKVASLGFPGGLSAETFIGYAKGYGLTLTLAQSEFIRTKWLETFPEMKEHLKSDKDYENNAFMARSFTGTLRANCGYCESCNHFMQNPAAEGVKVVIWDMMREKIDTVNMIHDETLNEVPADLEQARLATENIQYLMIRGMRKIVRDVAIRTEAILMDRWYKTKPKFDSEKKLLIVRNP